MPAGRPRQDAAQRVERAERILDAAGELILRWGYDKTTIDDVARASHVAKGTIYLHWRSREALFVALLRRERVGLLAEVERALAAEPDTATPAGLLAALARALDRQPIVRAVLVGDREVLGRLGRHTAADPTAAAGRRAFIAYVDELRAHGLVRDDLSTAEQVAVVAAVFFGFFSVTSFLPDELALREGALQRLVGETVGRTLAPARRLRRAEVDEVSRITMRYVGEFADLARAEYAKVVGADEVPTGKDTE
ncbi:MAG TPA: helix-turn-helix domain-containing protein [Streptosporangiales bacterium]